MGKDFDRTYVSEQVTAETIGQSCTGGLIATVLSEAPGAAEHFEGGFVVYTPTQKSSALKVPQTLIKEHGTVSVEVAVAMAEGAGRIAPVEMALSVPLQHAPCSSMFRTAVAKKNGACAG